MASDPSAADGSTNDALGPRGSISRGREASTPPKVLAPTTQNEGGALALLLQHLVGIAMPRTPRTPRAFLPLIAAAMLFGCAAEMDPHSTNGDSADDLKDRDITLESSQTHTLDRGRITIRAQVTEHADGSMTITTEEVVSPAMTPAVYRAELGDSTVRYGFLFDYRRPGESWTAVTPVQNDPSYVFSQIILEQRLATSVLTGTAFQYVDAMLGLTTEQDSVPFEAPVELPRDSEFRIRVIPTWNWGDWEEDGYEAVLTIEDL